MVAISQMTFSSATSWMRSLLFKFVFHWRLNIGSGNGLARDRWQAITWTNAAQFTVTYVALEGDELTHWGRVTLICVSKLTIIGSDNGFSPGRRQAIIWTNAGILLIWPLGTNFSEISIDIEIFSFKKIHFKMSSGKWRPFCIGLNVLISLLWEILNKQQV